MMKPLTPTARAVLRNVVAGRKPSHGFYGRSESGPLHRTLVGLNRRKLIAISSTDVTGHNYVATDAGRAALQT